MNTATVQAPARHGTAAAHDGQVRITGVLLEHAEVRHTAGRDSHALLVARIGTGTGMPHEAVQDFGTSPSGHLAAESKARRLRRGAAVTVTCRGEVPRADHGHAVLRCLDVTDLFPHDLPASTGQGA